MSVCCVHTFLHLKVLRFSAFNFRNRHLKPQPGWGGTLKWKLGRFLLIAIGWHSPPAAQGISGIHPGRGGLPLQGTLHPHAELRVGQFRHDNSPNCPSLGGGRKLESLEKTHTDKGRTRERHTNSGLSWESISFLCSVLFFFVISTISK